MSRAKTEEAYQKLSEVIPGGVNSPVRACIAMQQLPLIASHAEADLICDVDNKSYIDYCGSWGALIHGHAHPQILKAVEARMRKGTSFGVTTEVEELLARKIKNIVKSVEKVRFVSSGTEATMSAVRLARGFTSRDLVVKFSGNYHGHADFFLVQAGSGVMGLSPASSSRGIPEEMVKHTLSLPYNDIETAKNVLNDPKIRGNIACVILEPIAGNMGVVKASLPFLKMLREETERNHTLLIFDEVISGFRVGKEGAQGLFGITPDLSCFGKIIGGGFPAAAFGGRKDIMDFLAPLGPVYQAGTLSGNPVAMEAGLQALALLEEPNFYESLQAKSDLLIEPLKECIKKKQLNACIQSVGSMFTLFFGLKEVNNLEDAKRLDGATYARFFRSLFNQGIYIPPLQQEAWFISAAHTEKHLLKTRDIILNFMNNEV